MKHQTKTLLFASIFSFSLVACGGGSSVDKTAAVLPSLGTIQQQIIKLEASGDLPKLDRTSSLGGVDADGNGVRDDIDAYITANYTVPAERNSAKQMASAFQSVMSVDISDGTAVRVISTRSSRATHCIFITFKGGSESKQPSVVAGEIESISMNTKPRLLKYLSYAKALNGSVMTSPKGNTCE